MKRSDSLKIIIALAAVFALAFGIYAAYGELVDPIVYPGDKYQGDTAPSWCFKIDPPPAVGVPTTYTGTVYDEHGNPINYSIVITIRKTDMGQVFDFVSDTPVNEVV